MSEKKDIKIRNTLVPGREFTGESMEGVGGEVVGDNVVDLKLAEKSYLEGI